MSSSFRIVNNDGIEYGPVDRAELRFWCCEGRITEDDSLYCADSGQFLQLADIFDIHELEHSEPLAVFAAGRVKVVVGDITRQRVDVIVNAANASLLGGGGVDGAIHRAGGSAIMEACKAARKTYPAGLPTGEAVITTAGKLACSFVIHTVGPVYAKDDFTVPVLLTSCYLRSLQLAAARNLASIAFPAISCGVYGYPLEKASIVASKAVHTFLVEKDGPIEVRFVFYSRDEAQIFIENNVFESV